MPPARDTYWPCQYAGAATCKPATPHPSVGGLVAPKRGDGGTAVNAVRTLGRCDR